jgi:hypothetical protein
MPQLPGGGGSKPIFEEKPDVRFATTFLSNRYRDYAVEGESLMDKVTGELFIKREKDGVVVSHSRDKITTSEIVHNLWFLMKNNPEFKIIRKPGLESSKFSVCDIDMFGYVNDECDVSKKDFKIDFNTNKIVLEDIESSGVFISVNTRTSDKIVTEIFNDKYGEALKSTTTVNTEITQEKERFMKNFHKDLRVLYQVKYKNNSDTVYQVSDMETYIKSNELSILPIKPEHYIYDEIEIQIKNIDFVLYQKFALFKQAYETSSDVSDEEKLKIQSMSTTEFFTYFFNEKISNFIFSDTKVVVNDIVVYSIVSFEDITTENMFDNKLVRMIYLEDIDVINSYLNKISTSYQNQVVIYSGTRPDTSIWTKGSIWVEPVETTILKTLKVNQNPHVTDKNTLEKMLSGNKNIIQHVTITTIDPEGGNILVTPNP